MALIQQTSLNPTGSNGSAATVNTILRKIQIQAGAFMTIFNNGGAMRIVSVPTGAPQGMIIVSGSQIQILGV